jgi:excisionase family DNA binding protein
MTVEQAAAALGVSRGTAYEAARTGRIPSIRIGRRLLVPIAALQAMLNPGVIPPETLYDEALAA